MGFTVKENVSRAFRRKRKKQTDVCLHTLLIFKKCNRFCSKLLTTQFALCMHWILFYILNKGSVALASLTPHLTVHRWHFLKVWPAAHPDDTWALWTPTDSALARSARESLVGGRSWLAKWRQTSPFLSVHR